MRSSNDLSGITVFNCANQHWLAAVYFLEDLSQQMTGSSFAVRPADADHLQLLSRMSVKICAQPGQRPPPMADASPGDAGARLFSRRIGHHGDRSTLHGRVNVAIAVGGFAFHRRQNEAR